MEALEQAQIHLRGIYKSYGITLEMGFFSWLLFAAGAGLLRRHQDRADGLRLRLQDAAGRAHGHRHPGGEGAVVIVTWAHQW